MVPKRHADGGADGEPAAKKRRISFGGATEAAIDKGEEAAKRLLNGRRDINLQTGLTFLFAKGVDKLPVRDILGELGGLADPAREPNLQLRKKYQEARERLLRLTAKREGDKHRSRVPPQVESWGKFLKKAKEWKGDKTSFVFFRDHGKVKQVGRKTCLVQRLQKSGLCFLHAPSVLQHYLVAMGSGKLDAEMADLTKTIRRSYSAKRLYEHVFENRGGDSKSALEDFLLPDSVTFGHTITDITADTLKKYGPALVSNFQVRPEFEDGERWSFAGKPKGEAVGGHAMVLIGVRGKGAGRRFLLQNWWAKKQFVEVDPEYLELSKAEVHFVRTPQPCFPSSVPVLKDFFAEADCAEHEDGLPEEDSA